MSSKGKFKSRVGDPRSSRLSSVTRSLDESRSIADVAPAIGVNAGTLGNWVGQGLSLDERSDLVELRAECAQLRMERDLLKRSLALG